MENDLVTVATNLPTLKRIELLYIGGGVHEPLRLLLNDVIQCATKLEECDISYCAPAFHTAMLVLLLDVAPRLDLLRTIRIGGGKASYLDNMEILIQMAEREENKLRLQNFATYLNLPRQRYQEICTLLESFLRTQSSTLQVLEIICDGQESTRPDFQHSIGIQMPPVMAELRQLVAVQKLQSLPVSLFPLRLNVPHSTLESTFPRLNKLICDWGFMECELRVAATAAGADGGHGGDIMHDIYNQANNVLSHLQHTGIHLNIKYLDLDVGLPVLGYLYPSVTHLECTDLQHGQDIPEGLWTTWPALETLCLDLDLQIFIGGVRTIPPRLDLDAFLSGVPTARNSYVLNLLKASPPITLDKVRELSALFKRGVGISDMQRLREFTVKINQHTYFPLSYVSGYLGLAMANSTLQHINIQTSEDPFKSIPPECQTMIKNALGPTAVFEVTPARN